MNSGFIVINSDVGGDWNMTFSFPYMTFSFPYIGNVIIPIDSYFSEGLKPPTRKSRKMMTVFAMFNGDLFRISWDL